MYDIAIYEGLKYRRVPMFLICQCWYSTKYWLKHIQLLYLSVYAINNHPEIETNWDRREIETNLASQSRALACTTNQL